MDYFENRQNVTKQSAEELNTIFKCIADNFSHKWIKSSKGHPLQQLWKRKDALSTNELYFFGDCLKRLSEIDPKWVKNQISQIKSDHSNNRQGAFFEIIGLGILSTSEQIVSPTKGNNPGFDGVLSLNEVKSMRISIKNYGDSLHYQEFISYSQKVEKKLKEILKDNSITSIQVVIDSPKSYPSKQDWENLLNQIPNILLNYKSGEPKAFSISDFWFFMYGDLKDDYQKLHEGFNSYTLIISSTFHKNEEKNLLDKLDEACYNLIKHSQNESDDLINVVFIHLSESASIIQCSEWVNNYFISNSEKPITGIILYQPTVSSNLVKDNNFIHHCFQLIFRNEKFIRWNSLNKQINFCLPVGIIDNNPSENKLIFKQNEEKHTIDIKNKYMFQRGNLYLEGKEDEKGTVTGNVKRIASGVFAHSVFQPFPDQPAFVLSGHFPPVDKLLIL